MQHQAENHRRNQSTWSLSSSSVLGEPNYILDSRYGQQEATEESEGYWDCNMVTENMQGLTKIRKSCVPDSGAVQVAYSWCSWPCAYHSICKYLHMETIRSDWMQTFTRHINLISFYTPIYICVCMYIWYKGTWNWDHGWNLSKAKEWNIGTYSSSGSEHSILYTLKILNSNFHISSIVW